jgi:N6-L-threonylcarbamoyladenine synthase
VILALETSCDDSCAAVVSPGGEIHSNVISSQGVHDRYGGVVPEVASRHHLELLNVVVDDALRQADAGLDDVELVAVTRGPGLVGALLVGVQTAKGLAAARRLPLAAVDHLHGHVAANFLAGGWDRSQTPVLCLIASGGHTLLCRVDDEAHYEVLGRTLDDAAGEAFDKAAKLLGLAYPGGPAIEQLATRGNPTAVPLPRPLVGSGEPHFSFAGLKSAVQRAVASGDFADEDIAASFQQAVIDCLVDRT